VAEVKSSSYVCAKAQTSGENVFLFCANTSLFIGAVFIFVKNKERINNFNEQIAQVVNDAKIIKEDDCFCL